MHVSFLLLLAYFGYAGWLEGGYAGTLWSLLLVMVFFACVVLHELGHSLTAMRFGVRVPRILLLPIGGMAELDRIPRRPREELLIAVAGPAVNLIIVATLLPLTWHDLWTSEVLPEHGVAALLLNLTMANAVMAIFNFLPIFPMDGGRVFRALLAMRLPYLRATWWAAMIGKVLAIGLAGLATFYLEDYLLAALFAFIYFAGEREYRELLRREAEDAHWAYWHQRQGATTERLPIPRASENGNPI